ncbi:MAG: CRISPR-associated protein Csx20 [Desulfobacterium sp.]|nr:CRISPR-associated protein Csx20 [Desulfobacterium sp.]
MNKWGNRMFLVFSHKMTRDQIRDAELSLGVTTLVEMPDNLKELWRQISPLPAKINDLLEPLRQWLETAANPLDFVLIQGDFGATWLMVDFVFKQGLVPVYSITRREAGETVLPDGSVKMEHLFHHQQFRRYGC